MAWNGGARTRHWVRVGGLLLGLGVWPVLGWPADPAHTGSVDAPTAVDADLDAAYYRPLKVVQTGTSAAAVRKAAVAQLPLQELPPDSRAKAQAVLEGLGLYRRLPSLSFAVDPAVYRHLLQHPDVAVSTWRAMEISKFHLRATGPGVYHADAGDGSVGTVELWKSSPNDVLIYCDGAFKSPLLPRPIVARSIMRLQMRFLTNPAGQPIVEHSGDVFVAFPSQTVETVAKVISPVSHAIADRNFKQLSLYVHLMSEAMCRQPGWVDAMIDRMDAPGSQKAEFRDLAQATRLRAERRAVTPDQPIAVEQVIEPFRQAVVPVRGTTR